MEPKPGDEKKILYKGKRYFLQYETPTTGHAYLRIKQENNSEIRGDYAGTFVSNPETKKIEITPPKEGNKGPLPKDIPTVAKEVVPVAKVEEPPKATTTTTKKTAVKPPPAPTQPPYTGYFQKQQGLGCGRHALNNLFGREVFKKGVVGDVVSVPPPAEPISLLGVCKLVVDTLKTKGIKEYCSTSENYDVNTIHGALDILGYSCKDLTPSDVLDETGEFVGFLVNLGLISGKPKHWIALKFKRRNDEGVALYDYFDSLSARPLEEIPYSMFAAEHPQVFVVKVLLPKGEPVNPADRFIEMANVIEEPPKPAAKTAAATDCSVLYDPCTKKPVKDMAALEARVAELKAKQGVKAGGTRRKMKKMGRKTRKGRRV